MAEPEETEDDNFDKLLLALFRQGFTLPYRASNIDPKNRKTVIQADTESWELNRHALIVALTDSEWIAQ